MGVLSSSVALEIVLPNQTYNCLLSVEEEHKKKPLETCLLSIEEEEVNITTLCWTLGGSQFPLTSCNGLVLTLVDCDPMKLAIWNPKGEGDFIRHIPQSNLRPRRKQKKDRVHMYGFGFDPSSKDYKIIRIIDYQDRGSFEFCHFLVEMFSLRTYSWKRIEYPFGVVADSVALAASPLSDNICINGFCYWKAIAKPDGRLVIIPFDLASDNFASALIPGPPCQTSKFILAEFWGSLAVIARENEFKLWVWTGGESGWSLRGSWAIGDRYFARGFFENDKLILHNYLTNEVVLFDCAKQKLKDLGICAQLHTIFRSFCTLRPSDDEEIIKSAISKTQISLQTRHLQSNQIQSPQLQPDPDSIDPTPSVQTPNPNGPNLGSKPPLPLPLPPPDISNNKLEILLANQKHNKPPEICLLSIEEKKVNLTTLCTRRECSQFPLFCCHGLILTHLDCDPKNLAIWNPKGEDDDDVLMTIPLSSVRCPRKKTKKKTKKKTEIDHMYGFGFDPSSNDYKVIRFIDYQESENFELCHFLVEMFSLKNHSWKQIIYPFGVVSDAKFPESVLHAAFPLHDTACINGFCYWKASAKLDGRLVIIPFDLASDNFASAVIPGPPSKTSEFMLAEFEGSLAVIAYKNKPFEFELWVWNGGDSSWSLRGSWAIGGAFFVRGFFENDKLFLHNSLTKEVVLFDCAKKKLKNLGFYTELLTIFPSSCTLRSSDVEEIIKQHF